MKRSQLLVEGKEGFRILYSLNIPSYSQTYVTNFYLNPGGEKYLFMEGNLVSVGSRRTEDPVSLDKVHFDQIKSDVNLGLKGFYEVSWNKGDKSFEGILAQYPFSYAEAESPASLVFFLYPWRDSLPVFTVRILPCF